MVALHNKAYVQVTGVLSRLVVMEQIVYGGKWGEINLDHKGRELQYTFSAKFTGVRGWKGRLGRTCDLDPDRLVF